MFLSLQTQIWSLSLRCAPVWELDMKTTENFDELVGFRFVCIPNEPRNYLIIVLEVW